MSFSLTRLLAFAGSGLAAAAFAFPWTVAVAQEEREIVIQRVVVEEKGEKEEKDDDDDAKEKTSFWIGIALVGPGGADGLKIAEVYPDGPALKAELKAGDVLIAVGDKKLEGVEQLVDLVQDSQGQTLKVRFLRDGKEQVREVQPGKRPEATRAEEKEKKEDPVEKAESNRSAVKPAQPGTRWRPLEVAPKAGAGPQGGSGTMHLYTAPKGVQGNTPTGSGSAYPPGAMMPQPMTARTTMPLPSAQLPDDMEVTISKKGNKPAVVVAKQGDKLWKTTENELSMLPPPAQAYAAAMLNREFMRTRMRGGPSGMGGVMGMPGMGGMSGVPGMPGMPGVPGASPARREVRAIELRLDQDGKVEAVQEGKNTTPFKVHPDGHFLIEIRGEDEGKGSKQEGATIELKVEKKESKPEKSAAPKEDAERGRRIRQLQEEAERLRDLIDKVRAEAEGKK
ncbi:MAG: PDZ domain-containing protein [Pirellulaceae bacterium]|nr:PDZ domain-containing protein [Pirellulaceae bacterium]